MAAIDAVIREAVAGDLPEILALYAQLNADDLLPDAREAKATWDRMLASDMVGLPVAVVAGRVVASCVIVIVPNLTRGMHPFAMIENVVTAQEARGRGLGRRVIHAAFERAWAAGCYKVMLQTGRKDPAVLGFYESCGFSRSKTAFEIRRPAGIQPGLLCDVALDPAGIVQGQAVDP